MECMTVVNIVEKLNHRFLDRSDIIQETIVTFWEYIGLPSGYTNCFLKLGFLELCTFGVLLVYNISPVLSNQCIIYCVSCCLILPIFIRVPSQLLHLPSHYKQTNEVTMKNVGQLNQIEPSKNFPLNESKTNLHASIFHCINYMPHIDQLFSKFLWIIFIK